MYFYTEKFTYMKKEAKEMLKTIIHNQNLIMKALKIEIPGEEKPKSPTKKSAPKKAVKKSSKK